nr:glycosyltransferase family A protein [Echinicola marina]
MKNSKISICTTCMNRTHHLKKTLSKNIKDNSDYDNVDFVVLNYNSSDDLDTWIHQDMRTYLNSGKIKYIKTDSPKYFHMSHAKNIVAKYATGDIICNVDADNYTGVSFASYINQVFNTNKDVFVVPKNNGGTTSILGRVCVLKDDFLKVRGYDEEMKGYGWEDIDFYNRLELISRKKFFLTNSKYLKTIEHESDIRYSNYKPFTNINDIYIRYITPKESDIIYTFKDYTFEKFRILSNGKDFTDSLPGILEEFSQKGLYNKSNRKISFGDKIFNICDSSTISNSENTFYKISDNNFLEEVKRKYSLIWNYSKLLKNNKEGLKSVNRFSFGELEF